MKLKKLNDHIWIMPYESERDRPNLGYVKGDNWSLAIDAGHSAAHTKEFYALHESIRKEYSENKEVIVKLADIVYSGELTLDLGGCTVKVIQTEAPHTDDSTLVYIENDKILFTGDSTGDEFLTGIKDPALCKKLADTIRQLNPQTCVEGHWVPVEADDTLNDLLSGV